MRAERRERAADLLSQGNAGFDEGAPQRSHLDLVVAAHLALAHNVGWRDADLGERLTDGAQGPCRRRRDGKSRTGKNQ